MLETDADSEVAKDGSGVVSKSSVRKSDTEDSVSEMVHTDISGVSLREIKDKSDGGAPSSIGWRSRIEASNVSILKGKITTT